MAKYEVRLDYQIQDLTELGETVRGHRATKECDSIEEALEIKKAYAERAKADLEEVKATIGEKKAWEYKPQYELILVDTEGREHLTIIR